MKIALPLAMAVTLVSSAAMAQTTTAPTTTTPSVVTPAPSTSPAAPAAMPGAGVALTDAQVSAWIDKTIYSSDDKNVGEVAEIRRDSTGKVTELYADVGGFLGIGETRVKLMPSQFSLGNERVVLNLTSEQVKALPKVQKK